ncbi:MAG TPA: glycosyltransferase family 39 protein [Acidobacteriaceae bacterium]|nr:glycosyltransferase family 39 protein [Acidobacteriaceae bacterium]
MAAAPQRRIPAAPPALPLAMLYPVFFAAVYLSHLTLLRLPYFWDEAGYYIPAAWDFYRTGTLIPVSTMTNAHPPLPSVLLAGWWRLWGFVPIATRTLVCMVSAAALLAVYRMARGLVGTRAAAAVAVLTGLYPVWFAQSTLAHADIFAAAFTLWGLAFYVEGTDSPAAIHKGPGNQENSAIAAKKRTRLAVLAAAMFSLAALSKETAVITPLALAAWEGALWVRERRSAAEETVAAIPGMRRVRLKWVAALAFPALPLAAWYAYHFHHTGFIFGNPDFLRYNATDNLNPQRIGLCLYHRLLHLTMHMNLFVPVTCAVAAWLSPAIVQRSRLPRAVMEGIGVVLLANWIAFSILGGALLTRYLLPMYPLVLLVCVAEWRLHFRAWIWLAAFTAAAFLAGLWINPPYSFAPEDNLTYRDFIVLHQQAVAMIARQWPQATVLTAWPATSELSRPELGYTKKLVKVYSVRDFTLDEMEKAAQDPGDYDTALVFSTKWVPARSLLHPGAHRPSAVDMRYFDFHQDMQPAAAAALLHGDIVWQAHRNGEWIAVLRFPRVVDAKLDLR